MSINIGTEAVNAVIELRGNRDFERLVVALSVITQNRVLGAIAAQPDIRTDATAYARGMYDLWEAIEAARLGVQISQVKPPPMKNRAAREDANV